MRRNVSIILPSSHYNYDREQGVELEKFVLLKLSSKDFTCLPSPQGHDLVNVHNLSGHQPNLVFSYEHNKKKGFFAIECKWRKKDFNGYMPWAEPDELREFRDYQEKMNTPIFVVIGVGGAPAQPEDVLVIPFRYISEQPVLDMHHYKTYYRPLPNKKFFLDVENMVLK